MGPPAFCCAVCVCLCVRLNVGWQNFLSLPLLCLFQLPFLGGNFLFRPHLMVFLEEKKRNVFFKLFQSILLQVPHRCFSCPFCFLRKVLSAARLLLVPSVLSETRYGTVLPEAERYDFGRYRPMKPPTEGGAFTTAGATMSTVTLYAPVSSF